MRNFDSGTATITDSRDDLLRYNVLINTNPDTVTIFNEVQDELFSKSSKRVYNFANGEEKIFRILNDDGEICYYRVYRFDMVLFSVDKISMRNDKLSLRTVRKNKLIVSEIEITNDCIVFDSRVINILQAGDLFLSIYDKTISFNEYKKALNVFMNECLIGTIGDRFNSY